MTWTDRELYSLMSQRQVSMCPALLDDFLSTILPSFAFQVVASAEEHGRDYFWPTPLKIIERVQNVVWNWILSNHQLTFLTHKNEIHKNDEWTVLNAVKLHFKSQQWRQLPCMLLEWCKTTTSWLPPSPHCLQTTYMRRQNVWNDANHAEQSLMTFDYWKSFVSANTVN